jgi:hypothetical protein
VARFDSLFTAAAWFGMGYGLRRVFEHDLTAGTVRRPAPSGQTAFLELGSEPPHKEVNRSERQGRHCRLLQSIINIL